MREAHPVNPLAPHLGHRLSPEAEAATRAAATAFTEQLKARGAKYWQKVAKQEAKAARKSAQND